ncbi:MAG: tyrosine--tRNA ligase [Desulfobacteraceae bacterium]|nr:MAG: tyrosine--tRNA ligase [Desulfobacteraceae bacterium]
MSNKETNILDELKARGFVEQITDEKLVREQWQRPTTVYIGFDPTASSLHVGNLVPVMSLMHIQRFGHRPIAVIGGGTTLVGDPSGKTEMRPIMLRDEIDKNAAEIKKQLGRFLDFNQDRALLVNNADWLTRLNYIDFLREFGRHFSVNRMLAAESYKVRFQTGLNFIEFNYMLLQAYDFWHLFKHYDCRMQMGGNDQWGNILAGTELIRRMEGADAHAVTFPLITTADGIKMGKTHKGAVWLDPARTSPYDYYQYWINQDDRDVVRFLGLFTFLPMDEIRRLGALKGEAINQAKEILAYEATKICHGEAEAEKARKSARQLFGSAETGAATDLPSFRMELRELAQGVPAYILFEKAGLCKTRSDARRLIAQGGGYVNGERIEAVDRLITQSDLKNGFILMRAGRKHYLQIIAT